ncbi:hypothetical protein WJX72_005683 [[Myrmecia] bisecta]|uniref:ABC transporter domain-containing protein n=1 Tax=[Myrmecia] bisecta TaxID=41462 RepID=A0AAW1Q7Y3_9CHLO
MDITFWDLSFGIHRRRSAACILSSITACLDAGKMTAVLGPTGCGKTTLLDVLAGRKNTGKITGTILYGGRPPTQALLRRHTGFVQQNNTLLENLTVHEMLMYTAELQSSWFSSIRSKRSGVERILEGLKLQGCRNVKIGSVLAKGISGGQAKRVSIGIGLILQPKVLFMDEPTSGLDSYTARQVMELVHGITKGSVSVCCTIHQPTASVFSLFDNLLMLVKGQVAYSGRNGQQALDFFQRHTPTHTPQNEAEWFIDIIGLANETSEDASALVKAYQESALRRHNEDAVRQRLSPEFYSPDPKLDILLTSPLWWTCWVLLKYRGVCDFCSPSYLISRTVDKVVFTLFLSTLYWGQGRHVTAANVQNISGIFFMATVMLTASALNYLPSIMLERPVLLREVNDGLYRPVAYLIAKLLQELIIIVPSMALVMCVIYFAVGWEGPHAFYWLAQVVTCFMGTNLGYLVAAAAPNFLLANALLPSLVVSLLFFVGYLIKWTDIPDWWIWYGDINPMRYAFGALMHNMFDTLGERPGLSSRAVLEYYSLTGTSKWAFLGYEAIFIIVFFCLTLLSLSFLRRYWR